MKIVQEIELPENCESCITRAAAANQPFSCLALDAKAALEKVNAEAAGVQELEKTRKDLATPILQRMVGTAVANSLSTWSPKNEIKDVQEKMSKCPGPVILRNNEGYTVAKSLIFHDGSGFMFEHQTTQPSELVVESTDLLDENKYQIKEVTDGIMYFRGRNILTGVDGIKSVNDAWEASRIINVAHKIMDAARITT